VLRQRRARRRSSVTVHCAIGRPGRTTRLHVAAVGLLQTQRSWPEPVTLPLASTSPDGQQRAPSAQSSPCPTVKLCPPNVTCVDANIGSRHAEPQRARAASSEQRARPLTNRRAHFIGAASACIGVRLISSAALFD
jgi:hypothetical protein